MYKKLLLSTGGGIIDTQDQIPQAEVATVAIGLGGTGVDCLRELKKSVYTKLVPDVVGTVVPQYKHIKFLAVDSDETSLGDNGSIDSINKASEFFPVSVKNIHALFDEINNTVNPPEEFGWLQTKSNNSNGLTILNAHAGAGGVRQVGRFLIMKKSYEFLNRVKNLITEARKDLPGDSNVNILIFTGLGGGTGSGTFLDVCYIVKKALADLKVKDISNTLGFFFLPDVNISHVKIEEVKDYIQINGFAAMKELDYCMNFEKNHGCWNQKYTSFEIKSNEPPVTLAHLVTATKANDQVISDSYSYSMHAVSEYIMEFLKKPYIPEDGKVGNALSIKSHIGNINQIFQVIQSGRVDNGACYRYCAIGASSYYVPFKEINTYLVGKIFEGFKGFCDNRPTENDLISFCTNLGLKYEDIATRLNENVPAVPMRSVDISTLYDQCHGISTDVIPQSLKYMIDAKAVIVGKVTENKKNLLSEKGAVAKDAKTVLSLIAKVKAALKSIASDPEKGPAYAAAMIMDTNERDFSAVINGYIKRTNQNISQERANLTLREDELAIALSKFQNSGKFTNRKSRGETYIAAVNSYYTTVLKINFYDELKDLLESFNRALKELYNSYFNVFADLARTLEQTFEENVRYLLANQEEAKTYSKPLMTVAELKPMLDSTVRDMNVITIGQRFFAEMLEKYEEVWLARDENKISKCVIDYFTRTLNTKRKMTISECLRIKFDTDNSEMLVSKIDREIITPALQEATPLFWGNAGKASTLAYCTVPQVCSELDAAADQVCATDDHYTKRLLETSDTISTLEFLCGLSLFEYTGSDNYFARYNDQKENFVGCHYYEKDFEYQVDFRKISNMRPYSKTGTSTIFYPSIKQKIEKYDEAYDKGLVYVETAIDETQTYHLRLLDAEAIKEFVSKVAEIKEKGDVAAAEALAEKDIVIPVKETYLIDIAGQKNNIQHIAKDNVIASSVMFNLIMRNLPLVDEFNAAKAEVAEFIESVNSLHSDKKNFVTAYLAGVIDSDSMNVYRYFYSVTEDFVTEEADLTSIDSEPYGMDLPLYSAFVNYCKLPADIKTMIGKAFKKAMVEEPDVVAQRKKDIAADIQASYSTIASTVRQDYAKNADEILAFYKEIVSRAV